MRTVTFFHHMGLGTVCREARAEEVTACGIEPHEHGEQALALTVVVEGHRIGEGPVLKIGGDDGDVWELRPADHFQQDHEDGAVGRVQGRQPCRLIGWQICNCRGGKGESMSSMRLYYGLRGTCTKRGRPP